MQPIPGLDDIDQFDENLVAQLLSHLVTDWAEWLHKRSEWRFTASDPAGRNGFQILIRHPDGRMLVFEVTALEEED